MPLTVFTIPKLSKPKGIRLTNNIEIKSKDKNRTDVAVQTIMEEEQTRSTALFSVT
jgi:hypothetical protein